MRGCQQGSSRNDDSQQPLDHRRKWLGCPRLEMQLTNLLGIKLVVPCKLWLFILATFHLFANAQRAKDVGDVVQSTNFRLEALGGCRLQSGRRRRGRVERGELLAYWAFPRFYRPHPSNSTPRVRQERVEETVDSIVPSDFFCPE